MIDSRLIEGGGGGSNTLPSALCNRNRVKLWLCGPSWLMHGRLLRPLETNNGEGGGGVISVRTQRLKVSYVLQIVLTNYIRD